MRRKKLGEIRPNQLITTYGPGAIYEAVNDSLTVLDIRYWSEENRGKEIHDSRLANFMSVSKFYMPKAGGYEDIPVVSFPYCHVCSKSSCGLLFDMREHLNLEDYREKQGQVRCPQCGFPAYPARFIVMCGDGHMDDFPWRWWVHHGDTSCKEALSLRSTGSTSSLAELIVECGCGKRRSLAGATQWESFEGLKCSGNHPHRPGVRREKCGNRVVPSQRGASNVYFPVVKSAISIPPWTNPINELISEHRRFLESYMEDFGEEGLTKAYEKFFAPKYTRAEFDEAWEKCREKIREFVELKVMEYAAITHHDDVAYQHNVRHFKAREVPIQKSLLPYFSRVIQIERLREVRVLTGFMRLESPEPDIDEQQHIVPLKSHGDEKWLPAVEINGEGIFIELNRERVAAWSSSPMVQGRSKKYMDYYSKYCSDRGWKKHKPRNAEYVLLHSLSHMLIKEMAMHSGYSSAAMHERIYSGEGMCGLLIYTGAPDAEGSLGGLVELGSMEKFIPLLKGALEDSLTCTTDPECFTKEPTTERLSGAACHSCTMIAETTCENGNRLLDRALVVPLPEHEEMGYFRELVRDLCGIEA